MRHSKKIKKATKAEVVVDEAVADAVVSNHFRERYLKSGKHLFELVNGELVHLPAPTAHATAQQAYSKKLFLHKSVSRWRPPQQTIVSWVGKMRSQRMLLLKSTGCHITLAQPRTRRPGRTFYNPTLRKTKSPYNDGLSFSALVLLADGCTPTSDCDEASHLCGHGRCVNPEHLRWENLAVNYSRRLCHEYGEVCDHEPPCIVTRESQRGLIAAHLARTNKK